MGNILLKGILAGTKIKDILIKGNLTTEINTQQDLVGHEIYNITSINDNEFGNNPHIHIGGK